MKLTKMQYGFTLETKNFNLLKQLQKHLCRGMMIYMHNYIDNYASKFKADA